jgi:hypothetical protein
MPKAFNTTTENRIFAAVLGLMALMAIFYLFSGDREIAADLGGLILLPVS